MPKNQSRYEMCEFCRSPFLPQRKTGRFCSPVCRSKAWKAIQGDKKAELAGFTKQEKLWAEKIKAFNPRMYDLITLARSRTLQAGRCVLYAMLLAWYPETEIPPDLEKEIERLKLPIFKRDPTYAENMRRVGPVPGIPSTRAGYGD